MNNLNENELVIRLQIGDVNAFNDIYYKYHSAVYYNVLKLTKDTIATEDILQEVFITLWEKRLTLDPQRLVSGWLFVISYNKSVDHLKKIIRQSFIHNHVAIEEFATNEPNGSARETQFKLLEEAMSKLSPQKRKVFELCKLQGKTYDETAKELAISKHTVKEYLSAAVTYVKKYVSQHPDYHSACIEVAVVSIILMA